MGAGRIVVDPEGLLGFSVACRRHAADVADVAAAPPAVPATGQATAAVVKAIHATVAGVGDALGQRVAYTGASAALAAQLDSGQDATNANLSTVGHMW